MQIDIFKDIGEICRERLIAAGYRVQSSAEAEEVLLRYIALLHRTIIKKPRTVHHAKELNCPQEHKLGFELICQKALEGEPLRPHQSKSMEDVAYNDKLFNDWGIQHFHLGTVIEANGRVTRTGLLLLVRVTEDDFFCIGIYPHGCWYQKKLLQILHDNWPASIQHARCNGVVGLSQNYADADIKKLRNSDINIALEMPDGTVYFGPGGGMLLGGVQIHVLRATDKWADFADALERHIGERLDDDLGNLICTALNRTSLLKDKLVFRFSVDHTGSMVVVEKTSNIEMSFGQFNLPEL